MTENTPAYRVEGSDHAVAPSREMPRYISQKLVHALRIRIVEVTRPPLTGDGASAQAHYPATLHFADALYAPLTVDEAFVAKHNPQPGTYLVVYGDGYRSISPAAAFEAGNTLAELWGIPRHQEPKYATGERGRIVNRVTGKPVPDDEPVLFLRAQDKLALPTLIKYRDLAQVAGCDTSSLDERLLAFSAFAENHPERMKFPSLATKD